MVLIKQDEIQINNVDDFQCKIVASILTWKDCDLVKSTLVYQGEAKYIAKYQGTPVHK